MTAKVKYAKETLKILKKQEFSNIPCYENVEIFNLLNDEDYTHFSDVIDWIPQAHDGEEPTFNLAVQKKLCNSIEKTVYDDRLTLQQLNYLTDDLETYTRMLKVEKLKVVQFTFTELKVWYLTILHVLTILHTEEVQSTSM
jgi:hypothetical protein